jgi:N-acetylglucosamine-6-phosphate deacetylase
MNQLLIKNAIIYNSDKRPPVDILIEDEKIKAIEEKKNAFGNIRIFNVSNKIITPGLIDVHIQGAGGSDILDNSAEAVEMISKILAKFGVTGFLATTVLQPKINNKHIEIAANYYGKRLNGANLLGIHLEGPFINPGKLGGISPLAVLPPSLETLNYITELTGDSLKMMTIAPEINGSGEIIKKLCELNIVASFGHSLSTIEETQKGFEYGISHVTHLFNAMHGIHHRKPGPIPAIFENDKISVQLICDGVHIHKNIIRMIYDFIGSDRCICITDGIQAIGLPEGKYFYNGKEYESKEGSARYLDGTLIGTARSLNEIILNFWKFTGCTFEEAINTATINPARLLGIDKDKGTIAVGKDADLVVWDEDYSIYATIVNGKIIYQK